MLRAIEFKDKRFRTKEDYNLFSSITENTIILCHNYKLVESLAKEILNTVNGKAEYNNYDCDDEDVVKAKMWLSFGLQRIIDINVQRITLALEHDITRKDNVMKQKLTKQEYEEIERLVDYALVTPNKKDAQKYINKIKTYEYSLCGNASYILGELICYVEDASGRVSDKEKRVYSVKSKLYELESYGVEKEGD